MTQKSALKKKFAPNWDSIVGIEGGRFFLELMLPYIKQKHPIQADPECRSEQLHFTHYTSYYRSLTLLTNMPLYLQNAAPLVSRDRQIPLAELLFPRPELHSKTSLDQPISLVATPVLSVCNTSFWT
jgi:hypothetical protein